MKKVMILLIAFVSFFFFSCEEKGPKGDVVLPERNTNELVDETIRAIESNGYVYKMAAELHYRDGGEWKSAGMHKVFTFTSGQSECNDWVLFGQGIQDLMPVYYTDDYGYTFRVQYRGVNYYYQ